MTKAKSRQVAVIPTRRSESGDLEVCLVTTRSTGRWFVPKGWFEKGKTARDVAEMEAFEEAGLKGSVEKVAIGSFDYFKRLDTTFDLVSVDVYVMQVKKTLNAWPEQCDRQREWVSLSVAHEYLNEPGLMALMDKVATRTAA